MTLAYYGKSRKRGVGLALAAILAIILGTVGAVSLQGGSARADADANQINISSMTCVTGGVDIHFNAPHADEGTATDPHVLTVHYTINGGGDTTATVNEDQFGNGHPNWTLSISGSGTFTVVSATSGSLAWDGNGGPSVFCGSSTLAGSVHLQKVWLDASGNETDTGLPASVSFTATGTGMSDVSLTSPTWSHDFTNVSGDVTITENAPDGWKVVGVNCSVAKALAPQHTNGGDASFTVDGEAWNCTFTNQKLASTTGTLTVYKALKSAPSGVTEGDFSMHVLDSNGQDVATSPQPGSTAGTSYTLPAGHYTVSETGGTPGFSQGFTGDCVSGGAVTVTAGAAVTCTITNDYSASTLTGSITINKYFVEADGTTKATDNLPTGVDFTYTGANGGGSFTLTADKSWTWNLPDAPVGYYHFDEASIPGWHTVDVHCYSSAVTPRSAVAPEADASFTLKEGESWTCDFTNQRVEQSSQTYTVTVEKYISDALATTGSFSLSSTTTASNVPGCESGCTNPFTLDSNNGWMATTTAMAAGSQYSVVESGVAASAGTCTANDTYYLAGYKMGATLADAQAAPLDTSASITDLQSNMYVIVVNQLCAQSNVGGTITINKLWQDANGSQTSYNLPASVDFSYTDPNGDSHTFTIQPDKNGMWTWTLPNAPTGHYSFQEMTIDGWHTVDAHCSATPSTMAPESVEADASFTMNEGENWTCTFTNQPTSSSQTYTVTIAKYISGAHADATNANNTTFNMDVSYTINGSSGTGTFTLSPAPGTNTTNAYEAVTVPLTSADAYATNETGVPTAPGQCTAETPFYLAGYRVSSTSMANAASQPLSTTSPSFTNLQSNQYVIVVNQPCQAQNLVGSITIVKSWEDAQGNPVSVDSSQVAGFTGTGTGVDATFDLTASSTSAAGPYSRQFFGLANGTYSFTEGPITGWALHDITCTPTSTSVPHFDVPGSTLSIDFNNTEGMTCTFHNQQQAAPSGATLTIVKEWRDANGTVMTSGFGTASFTSDVSGHESFMLGTNNVGGSNQLVISGITPGTYHLTEAGQAGWNFVNVGCTNNALTKGLVPSTSFGVIVPENGNITCTVVNQAVATGTTGSITIVKQWVNNDMTPLPANLIPGEGATFTASGTGVSGFSLPMSGAWSNMFSGLTAGTFGFNENAVTGFTLHSASCTDNANSAPVNFDLNGGTSMYEAALAAGQNITCTFVNEANSQLATFVPPTFTFVPIPGVVTTPTASPSASPSATQSPSATTTTTPPTTVPTNESPSTNTGNTGVNEQPSNLGNNAPSANNAVAGVQAPGAPSTGSGSAMGSTGNTLAIALGLVTIAASAAAFAFSRKNRS